MINYICSRSCNYFYLVLRENIYVNKVFVFFDEYLERVRYVFYEFDDFRVGEVCIRVVVDGNYFIFFIEFRFGCFVLVSDLSEIKREVRVRVI